MHFSEISSPIVLNFLYNVVVKYMSVFFDHDTRQLLFLPLTNFPGIMTDEHFYFLTKHPRTRRNDNFEHTHI